MYQYCGVVITALTVVLLGCWNPVGLQQKDAAGKANGCPNYLWVALIALLVGIVVCYFMRMMKEGKTTMFELE
jgi:H+/Cl- antiporter ClcA